MYWGKIGSFIIVVAGITILVCASTQQAEHRKFVITYIKKSNDIAQYLFPKDPDDIAVKTKKYMAEADEEIRHLELLDEDRRTFVNTVQALDRIVGLSNLAIWANTLGLFQQVSPQEEIRTATFEALKTIQNFFIDRISNNKKIYQALIAYERSRPMWDEWSSHHAYALQEFLDTYYRAGMTLPDEQLDQVRKLKKELEALAMTFDCNIAADKSSVKVTKDQLQGLPEEFLGTLKREANYYELGVDYPTYHMVMEQCAVEDTRRRLFEAFNKRAWPANHDVLEKIIKKRHEMARMIGFESYAHLNCDEQMARTPEQVEEFLNQLLKKGLKKEEEEIEKLRSNLPSNIQLTSEGKIKPWDAAFIRFHYKKEHCCVDEQLIAEYFPLEYTITGLLDLYKNFFGIDFVFEDDAEAWHQEVRLLRVYSADRKIFYGYLFLDLHPRPDKYSHAAHFTIVPATVMRDGLVVPGISSVVANFPRSQADRPALLKRDDVKTFFHEFGHALHALFGRSCMSTLSGTSVRRDFVEMPSQMLEEWLWQPSVLKQVSKHYQTGACMPDDLIDRIIALKRLDSGAFICRQAMLSFYSLNLFGSQQPQDIQKLFTQLHQMCRPGYAFHEDDHMYASFGHLTGYGAAYYSYLWSKVYALDLFYEIKRAGLDSQQVGQRYQKMVLEPGGSKDPNELLETFLGRNPSTDAFFADLGLTHDDDEHTLAEVTNNEMLMDEQYL